MHRILKVALASAALGFASSPAQAVDVIACGGGSNCLSDTLNVNLTSGDNLTVGIGEVDIAGPALGPEVRFTTSEAGGLDLDASGQATITAGDEGSLDDLTFTILTGFSAAEFSLSPFQDRGPPQAFGVTITTNSGYTESFTVGNQRFAVVAGVGETLTSVRITTPDTIVNNQTIVNPGFGSLTQLRVSLGPVGAVPEPGTWAMMLLGFGGVGVAMRRRRKVGTIAQLA